MDASLWGCGGPPGASSRRSTAEGQAEGQVGHSGGPPGAARLQQRWAGEREEAAEVSKRWLIFNTQT